jgi:hypothetical protein
MLTVGLYRIATPDVRAAFREFSPGGFIRAAAATVEPSKKFKVKNALQVYYWEQGKYPATLDALVESGLLQKAETEDSAGNPFSYQSHQSTYTLP